MDASESSQAKHLIAYSFGDGTSTLNSDFNKRVDTRSIIYRRIIY